MSLLKTMVLLKLNEMIEDTENVPDEDLQELYDIACEVMEKLEDEFGEK